MKNIFQKPGLYFKWFLKNGDNTIIDLKKNKIRGISDKLLFTRNVEINQTFKIY